jgi:signal peptidase II
MWKSLNLVRVIETLLAIILLVLIDQCMKVFISKIMLNNSFEDMQLLPFLNIVFVRNTGVSFGMFSEWGILGRYFFSIFSIVVGCFLILLAIFSDTKVFRSSLALISSGALGNAIDRVYFGGVIDFIDFFIYNFHWPAFNFADIFITVGVILLLFDNIFYKKNET